VNRPLIVAHRAMTPGATENARSSIAQAVSSGADLVELDVRLSLDRQPVVIHDAFLRRATFGRGWVRLWPSFALGRTPLRESPVRERISLLKPILREFPDEAQVALHLKERAALGPVLKAIARHGNPGKTWLWLEHSDDVYRATRQLPELRVVLLRPAGWTPSSRHRYFEEAQWAGASGVSVPWGVIDAGLLKHAHRHQLRVFSRLERLADLQSHAELGLDGVITSDPGTISDLLTNVP